MKRLALIFFCVFGIEIYAQGGGAFDYGVVWNKKLTFQLTSNQMMRLGSERLFRKSLYEESKVYKKIEKDLAQVLVIHEFIYNKLNNVNSILKDGKKLKYFFSYFNEIAKNGSKLKDLTIEMPEYAILYTGLYSDMLGECTKLFVDVKNITKSNSNNNFLLDPYDREIIIEKMLSRVRLINGYLVVLIEQLKVAKKILYIKQVPVLKDYISLDKMIIQSIYSNYNQLWQ